MAIVDDVNQSQIHAYALSLHVHVHVHENSDLDCYYVDANDVRLHEHVCVNGPVFCADGLDGFHFQ